MYAVSVTCLKCKGAHEVSVNAESETEALEQAKKEFKESGMTFPKEQGQDIK